MVRNPTVFLFLDVTDASEILQQAERTHQSGAVFCLDAENVKATTARIQANEGGLNIKRVNIYVVATAEDSQAGEARDWGVRLRELFCEDFAAVDLTLVVLLNESEQTPNTYKFLNASGEYANSYDKFFILSDRNERDEILPESKKNLHATVAALPLVNVCESHFNEILAAKINERNKVLFASAGFWQKPPPLHEENIALHRLADILSHEMVEGTRDGRNAARLENRVISAREEVISKVTSVAAKPLRIWELWGRNIKEAEDLLYGKEAERFFNRALEAAAQAPITEDIQSEITRDTKKLRQAASEEEQLNQAITETESRIRVLKDELEHAQATIIRVKLRHDIDYVKDQIGECYVIRFNLHHHKQTLTRLTEKHSRLKSYLEYIEGVIETIKALPLPEETTQPTPEEAYAYITTHAEILAPLAISLLRDDGLIREQHLLPDPRNNFRLLRIIGGFTPQNLTRWNSMESAARKSAAAQPHFADDLHCKANAYISKP
ncbi:MAG: hypothetical protein FWC89_06540 [Defluviitaleaceae bacterium]|nr:hypothetical protein [Defluviitaleaceae bacterium]